MRSAITPPKVNWFGWNLEYSEYIVGGWPWQILGAIHTVAKFERQPKFCCFCPLNNARFDRFPVGQILRYLKTTTSIGVAMKTFKTEFWKLYHKESFPPPQKNAKIAHKFSRSCDFRPPYDYTMAGNWLPNDPCTGCLVSIFTVRINSKSFPCGARSVQKRYLPNFRQRLAPFTSDTIYAWRRVWSDYFIGSSPGHSIKTRNCAMHCMSRIAVWILSRSTDFV